MISNTLYQLANNQRPQSSGLALWGAIIFFLGSCAFTIGFLYRIIILLTGRHREEGGFKVLGIPVTDILLLFIWAFFTGQTLYGTTLSQQITDLQSANIQLSADQVSLFRSRLRALITLATALHCLARVPLYLHFISKLELHPQILRPAVLLAPLVHIGAFIAVLVFQAREGYRYWKLSMLVFTASSDAFLLLFAVAMLLSQSVIKDLTTTQKRAAWSIVAIGVLSLAASIFIFTIPQPRQKSGSLALGVRSEWLLWLAIETTSATFAGLAPCFRSIIANDGLPHGQVDDQKNFFLTAEYDMDFFYERPDGRIVFQERAS